MKERDVALAAALGLIGLSIWRLVGPMGTPELADAPAGAPAIALPGLLPAAAPAPSAVGATLAATVPDQLRLRPAPDVDLDALARAYGLTIVRPVGPGGAALLQAPPGSDMDELQAALADDPRVERVGLNGVIRGAQDGVQPSLRGHQWHLDVIGATDSPAERAALSSLVVAVLDSGVAYAALDEDGVAFAQAPGLAPVHVVAPYDFVDHDERPLDEHLHGTHIATTIVGQGLALGVAPGAALMPVRVLDADNHGNEHDLIDGVAWAIDHGADVINLSLSFAAGYVPGVDLQRELERARRQGVVVLAATGNGGAGELTWPAASPHVIAVAAARPEARWDAFGAPPPPPGSPPPPGAPPPPPLDGMLSPSGYSNWGPSMTVIAPGGDLSRDMTGDGYPDGILAEAPYPGDPTRTGYFFLAGTSQATAIASGVALRLLGAGAAPEDVPGLLRQGAVVDGAAAEDPRRAAGFLSLRGALEALDAGLGLEAGVRVAAVGALQRASSTTQAPVVLVTAIDGHGEALAGVDVQVRIFDGRRGETRSCLTDAGGSCLVRGAAQTSSVWGLPMPVGFAYHVALVRGAAGEAVRPLGFFYGSDALEAILRGAEADDRLPADHQLAIQWRAGANGRLGALVDGVSFPSLGVGLAGLPVSRIDPVAEHALGLDHGLAGSPSGVVLNRAQWDLARAGVGLLSSVLRRTGVSRVATSTVSLNLDGSGLSTSPIGLLPATLAVATTRMGSTSFLLIDGSGLSTSPIGFLGTQLALPGGSLRDLSGVSLDGGVPVCATTDAVGRLAGTTLGDRVAEGGLVQIGGDPMALAVVEAPPSTVSSSTAAGLGAPVELR